MLPSTAAQRRVSAGAAYQSAIDLRLLAEAHVRQARRQLLRVMKLLEQSSERLHRVKTLLDR